MHDADEAQAYEGFSYDGWLMAAFRLDGWHLEEHDNVNEPDDDEGDAEAEPHGAHIQHPQHHYLTPVETIIGVWGFCFVLFFCLLAGWLGKYFYPDGKGGESKPDYPEG